MKISASIKSAFNQHEIVVKTNDTAKEIQVSTKPSGFGSSTNGGELLLLSLATCFCNDIYREGGKCNIVVSGMDVVFTVDFGADGEPGSNFTYKAPVISDAPQAKIDELIRHTTKSLKFIIP